MAIRSFTTSDGARWDVWDVFPAGAAAYAQQRTGDRRCPDPVLLYKGPERRKGERRGPPQPIRGILPGLERGWLVFASGGLKKRLAPPPHGWDALPDERLADLLLRAR